MFITEGHMLHSISCLTAPSLRIPGPVFTSLLSPSTWLFILISQIIVPPDEWKRPEVCIMILLKECCLKKTHISVISQKELYICAIFCLSTVLRVGLSEPLRLCEASLSEPPWRPGARTDMYTCVPLPSVSLLLTRLGILTAHVHQCLP